MKTRRIVALSGTLAILVAVFLWSWNDNLDALRLAFLGRPSEAEVFPPAPIVTPTLLDDRFEISLFAAEPDIVMPIGVAVDAGGRVLVVESHTHTPNGEYAGPATDRIRVFEDTDGDGRADRITTLFEGVKGIVSVGVHPGDGSIYIASVGEVFRLLDGRKTSIAKLAPAHTPHSGLCGFAFDWQGNVYFTSGENLSTPYRVTGIKGEVFDGMAGGVYRCRPDGSEMTRVAKGFWNPFHLCVDAYGRIILPDNDPDYRPPCRLLHVVEGGDYGYRAYSGRRGQHPFISWDGEIPGTLPMICPLPKAPSGILPCEGKVFPPDYHGDFLVTSWGECTVDRYHLEERGATFRAITKPFLSGTKFFRPVGIAQGPDGAIFVTDWVHKSYNIHPTGRIWRIRQKKIVEESVRSGPSSRLAGYRKIAASRGFSAAEARQAFQDDSPLIRAEMVRMLPEAMLDFAELTKDLSLHVQAAAVRRVTSRTKNWREIVKRALSASDPFLVQAGRVGLRQAASPAELREMTHSVDVSMNWNALLVLRELDDQDARNSLSSYVEGSDQRMGLAALRWAGEEKVKSCKPAILRTFQKPGLTREMFQNGLAALRMLDTGVPGEDESGDKYVAKVLMSADSSVSLLQHGLRALRPDHPSLSMTLRRLLDHNSPAVRLEAVRTLSMNPDLDEPGTLMNIASNVKEADDVRAEAIAGLSGRNDVLVEFAVREGGPVQRTALRSLAFDSLTTDQRKKLEALLARTPELDDLVGVVLNGRRREPEKETTGWWLEKLPGPANTVAGERLFHHPRGPGCFRCHAIDGRGGSGGPDLTHVGRSLSLPKLVESIVEPSNDIAPQYTVWRLELSDGQVVSGMEIGRDPTGGRYLTSDGQTMNIADARVVSRDATRASLMPNGLMQTLAIQEVRDLVAFLNGGKTQ